MKVLQINTFYNSGSTGKIAKGIQDACNKNHIQCITGYSYAESGKGQHEQTLSISSWLDCRIHGRLARYTMLKGCFSYFKTKRFLRKVKQYAPDLIQIHNLHGSYINIPLIFKYIKKNNIPVVWTFHDCWPFTGGCAYFDLSGCNKWKSGCKQCPLRKKISASPVDMAGVACKMKKKWFSNVENLTVVTPSEWLAKLVKESFLGNYPVRVLRNGVNMQIFCPASGNIRAKYGIAADKYVVLGVAFDWGERKGLDVFLKLASQLGNQYQIVLVGTNDDIDSQLPDNIISIHRTEDQHELAQLYTTADVFANPTREDNYPTVNMESLACGTPVITFNTGGSPESIDFSCGSVVEYNNVDALEREIRRVCIDKPYSQEDCLEKAKDFNETDRFNDYVILYRNVVDVKHRSC